METERITLNKVTSNDYPVLFKWRNSQKYREFVHYNTSVVSYKKFIEEFKADAQVRPLQFIIKRKTHNDFVGLIFTHSSSKDNSYCFVNLYIEERFEKNGYGPEAFALMLCHLFEEKNFYKLYFEVFEYNQNSLSSLQTAGFKIEGRFIGHKILNGVKYDVLRFAAYKDSVPRFKRIIERFTKL